MSPTAGFGLGTWVHALPSQCSTSALPIVLVRSRPTAHTSVAETALTANSATTWPGGVGLGTRVHVRPSQCSTRVVSRLSVPPEPTAHMSVAEAALTPDRPLIPALGVGTRAHLLPFQCSTRAFDPELVLADPTAQTLLAESSVTPDRRLPNAPGAGVGTRAQLVPFQCSASVLVVRVCPTAQASVAEPALTAASEPARLVIAACGAGGAAPATGDAVTQTLVATHARIFSFRGRRAVFIGYSGSAGPMAARRTKRARCQGPVRGALRQAS